MINELRLKAFKSYPETTVPLKPLTLFSGLNSTGKSSIIQALRMFHRAAEGHSPLLNGHGAVSDMRSRFASSRDAVEITCVVKAEARSDQEFTLQLTDASVMSPEQAPASFYIGADRLGPQAMLPLRRSFGELPEFGDRGEYVLDVL